MGGCGCGDVDGLGEVEKESCFDYAGDVFELGLELLRVGDVAEDCVDDGVAVVGYGGSKFAFGFAQGGFSAEFSDGLLHDGDGELENFDGDRVVVFA